MPTPAEAKANAVSIAAAQDLNDELMIVLQALDSVQLLLDSPEMGLRHNETRRQVWEAINSGLRLTALADEVLLYAQRRGLRGSATTTKVLTQSI